MPKNTSPLSDAATPDKSAAIDAGNPPLDGFSNPTNTFGPTAIPEGAPKTPEETEASTAAKQQQETLKEGQRIFRDAYIKNHGFELKDGKLTDAEEAEIASHPYFKDPTPWMASHQASTSEATGATAQEKK